MKYKDFIAQAAIEIMAQICSSFDKEMFSGVNLDPTPDTRDAAINAVVAAKALADELEESFAYQLKDTEDNRKMSDFEPFFDHYEV